MDDPTVVERKRAEVEEPTLFGARYRPIALLGSGGMGSVYLARDMQLDELVAVKVLRTDLAGSMLERFRDEVRLARRVTSPFVARTHDLAEHEGRFFVTMQYVEGETLSALVKRQGRMSIDEIVPIARDMCEGLAAVHAANVVHRDLKPANVMLTQAGRAMLTDFGIALRAETALRSTDGYGTPTYTAPEQLAGKAVDARADVYALGATLYALATGQRPFSGARTGLEPPPDPRRACAEVSDAFAAIVMRAMAIEPADRFSSCEAMRAAIDALRPATTRARPSELRAFVRALGARAGRRLTMTFDARGVAPSLAEAVRADLAGRLNARGQLRVVDGEGDAEATLDARLASVGERCLLALRLESIGDRFVFWSDALEGPLQALPQLLEHAANAIERAFVPSSMPAPQSSPFESAEIASLFLEGRAEYRHFWGTHLRKSIELFEKARALAPDHPLILAWCAAAHSRHRFFEHTDVDRDVGRELAERAVELAPEIPEVHVALATVHMQNLHTLAAVPHFVSALRIAPGLLEQRVSFARLLSECGAVEPSLALVRGAALADPSYLEPVEIVVRHHALRGRLDLAASEGERAIGTEDAFVSVALARYATWHRDRARFDAARARLDFTALDPQPRVVMELYGELFAGGAVSLAPIDRVIKTGAPRRRAFFQQITAEICAFREDEERTFAALEAAVDLGFFDVQWFDMCPLLEPLRGMLRFETLHATVRARAIAVLTEVERCLAK
jgi:serine/threonine-protein kinase